MLTILFLSVLIGVVAGLRAMTAPTLASWAAHAGVLPVAGTWLGFMASPWAVGVFTLLALAELVTDLLPSTPSRTVPMQLGGRLVTGALAGATVGAGAGLIIIGSLSGLCGALLGTYGGALARGWLARTFHSDPPAALSEDVVAIVLGLCAVGLI